MAENYLTGNPNQLHKRRVAAKILGISPVTLSTWEREGRIPRARRITPRFVAWTERDLLAVINGTWQRQEA